MRMSFVFMDIFIIHDTGSFLAIQINVQAMTQMELQSYFLNVLYL